MSSASIDRSSLAAERALRSRTASRLSNFFLTPMSFGLCIVVFSEIDDNLSGDWAG